ncbi:dethiobiotin synthase [Chitinophaga defluvii]|uniref:ATP-dependent dethiobiotin synthetase BioD n=1 Tax=Chitinophaga defluvii TaxID=3163343 RepID=A0ABV2T323_9BACT
MSRSVFITGIGTGVGKTVTAACVTEALQADYWKPVQSGLDEGTDTETVQRLLTNKVSVCHPEAYRLKEPASPHLAARLEEVIIEPERIYTQAAALQPAGRYLIMEGAGGLMVPLHENVFTLEVIKHLQIPVIIVAQNYLGSINHAMLTAKVLRYEAIPVAGWIFTGDYHTNESEVVRWSGIPQIGRIPFTSRVDAAFVKSCASELLPRLQEIMEK